MQQFFYFLKQFLYLIWNLFVNIFYYIRFWYSVFTSNFNQDYNTDKYKNGWEITFEDDFNTPEINWNRWNKWWSENNGDPLQTAADPSLDCLIWDGSSNIILRTIKNNELPSPFPCKTGYLYSAYDSWVNESGERLSKGWEQAFGYFEIRCKPPKQGKLFWPAFWLWGNTWPPEIDIFEFMSKEDIGEDHTKGISFTSHWGYEGKEIKTGFFGTQLGKTYRKLFGSSVNWDEYYHVYACKWSPYCIKWYIDDKCVYQTIYNIPTNKMSICVSNGAYVNEPPTDSDLPGDFTVDYVRAYKRIE